MGILRATSAISAAGGIANDADAQIFIDAMTTAPDSARETIINQFFLDIKGLGDFGTDNIFAQMDIAYLLAAHDEQAALLDIKRGFDATTSNSPEFEIDRGFTGTGGRHIDTTFVPSTDGVNYTQDDATFGAYSRTEKNVSHVSIGAGNDPSLRLARVFPRTVAEEANFSINQGGSESDPQSTALGLIIIERTASTTTRVYKDGIETDVSADGSTGTPEFSFFILANNQGGSRIFEFVGQIAFACAGSSLNATEHLNFFDATETYMDAIGAGVVA